ncbi:hypothetical protein [Pedobacter sp.]|uniref:hypothetical protein n=1 Tax=Pedobacter sp. TaxID=1411316 RepID=UPI00396C4917
MRKILIFALLISLSGTVFAQRDGNYNYSIGVRAYNLFQLPKILDQTNSSDYTTSYLNGLMVKFNDNQIGIRISGNYYFKKDFSFRNECDNCEIATGDVDDFWAKIGFEKNFNYSAIQPYFAVDLGFRGMNFKGKINDVNNASTSFNTITSKRGFIATPALGLKINPVKQISVFAECNMDFYFSYERQERTQNDAANTRTFAKFNKTETLINPVSIGIQIHLVDKY